MGTYGGPKIFNDFDLADMYYYMDTANSDCWDGTAIASDTKLYNLAQQNGSEYFYAYDSSTFTSTNYEITRDYIHRKFAAGTANTNWRGNVNKDAFATGQTGAMSGMVFLKGGIGLTDGQSNQNIYLGGFTSRVSFSLASGGTSQRGPGVLVYKDDGSGTLAHRTNSSNPVLTDEWCSAGYSAYVSSTNIMTVAIYKNGVNVSQGNYVVNTDSNNTTLPHGSRQVNMGGWSSGYGEFSGQYNNWMFFKTQLDDTDFKQIHNSFKGRYGI